MIVPLYACVDPVLATMTEESLSVEVYNSDKCPHFPTLSLATFCPEL